jgi:DNA-binding MarR family transcriptional regulator
MTKSVFDEKRREKWLQFVLSLNPNTNPRAVQLMDEMWRVSHTLHQIREKSVTDAGISYAKYRILMNLMFCEQVEDRDRLNPSEISRRQGTSRNTISALIRDLEDEGLIERHLDEKDRRKFNIQLTEDGRTRVHDHMRYHFRAVANCFNALTDEEQDTLSHLLHKVNESVRAAQAAQPDPQIQ